MLLGYFDRILLGRVNGCELSSLDGFFLGVFLMDTSWVIWKDVWLDILNGPQLGDLEVFLVWEFE